MGELSKAHPEELAQVEEIGSPEAGADLIERAAAYFAEEQERRKAAKRESDRRAKLSDAEKLLELDGMDDDVLAKLAGASISRPQHLASISALAESASASSLEPLELAKLRYHARVWLGTDEAGEELPTADSIAAEIAASEALVAEADSADEQETAQEG